MIPQETIEHVRQMNDIVDVVGQYVRLKKRGRNYLALCPFHTEKTASFSVSQDKQIFHCFGCGKGGNVFTFLMEHEHMTFIEAVRHLAARANITIHEDRGTDVRRELVEKVAYANQVAAAYFHDLLFKPKYATVFDKYLVGKRQVAKDAIEQFQIGLSGETWDGLIKYAAKKDLTEQDLEQAGLAIRSETKGTYFDRFRQRLMFPIFNLSGKPIAFGGRTLKKGEVAKYVNSPETPLYSKGNVLYGLNVARDAIREKNAVFVVEGYFDVVSLWQAGIRHVVASSGTAFTPQQARLLARFAEEVYLFFDADTAGQTAALRSVDALFDAGLEVKVVVPPEGEDPDSIARQEGAEKIEELRQQALGYIAFRTRHVDVKAAGIIGKEKLIKELGALAAKITDPTRRSLFLAEAADTLRVDPHLLQSAGTAAGGTSSAATPGRLSMREKLEGQFLSLLLSSHDALDEVFEAVSPDDFDSKQLSRLYLAMARQYGESGRLEATSLIDLLADDEAVGRLSEIASIDWPLDQVASELRVFVTEFIQRKQKRIRNRLQRELAEAEAAGDNEKASELLQLIRRYGL